MPRGQRGSCPPLTPGAAQDRPETGAHAPGCGAPAGRAQVTHAIPRPVSPGHIPPIRGDHVASGIDVLGRCIPFSVVPGLLGVVVVIGPHAGGLAGLCHDSGHGRAVSGGHDDVVAALDLVEPGAGGILAVSWRQNRECDGGGQGHLFPVQGFLPNKLRTKSRTGAVAARVATMCSAASPSSCSVLGCVTSRVSSGASSQNARTIHRADSEVLSQPIWARILRSGVRSRMTRTCGPEGEQGCSSTPGMVRAMLSSRFCSAEGCMGLVPFCWLFGFLWGWEPVGSWCLRLPHVARG